MTVLLVIALVIVVLAAVALLINPHGVKRVPPARPRRDTNTILNAVGKDVDHNVYR